MEIRININGATKTQAQQIEEAVYDFVRGIETEQENASETMFIEPKPNHKRYAHKCDRVNLTMPAGYRKEIESEAAKYNMTCSEYIRTMMKTFLPVQTVLSRLI